MRQGKTNALVLVLVMLGSISEVVPAKVGGPVSAQRKESIIKVFVRKFNRRGFTTIEIHQLKKIANHPTTHIN
jgi:hypothetical protein